MDSLPLELLHTVCHYLPTADVGNFRLVSQTFAAVGVRYLLPEIHTTFHPQSLERLESISKHPIYSQAVTSLFHEGDTLCEYDSREDWEKCIFQPYDERKENLERPPDTASDREKRAYARAIRKRGRRPRHQYSSDELDEGWDNYCRLLQMQEAMRMTDDDEKLLHQAMSRLPRLRSITYCTANYNRRRTPAMKRLFGPALVPVLGDDWHIEYANYDFFTKLLLGVDFAKTKLEALDAGSVDWSFMAAEDSVFARIKNSVRHLRTLSLNFYADDDDGEPLACSEYLEEGRLREFVTAASDLTELDVGFHDYLWIDDEYPPALGHIVGEIIWPNLVSVGFHCILVSEEDLLQFFERHAGTLRRVSLETITLGTGSWVSTLKRMRQTLSLEDFYIHGSLRFTGSFEEWLLEPKEMWDPEEICLSQALRRYFLEDDLECQCPLLDEKFSDCLEP